MKKSKLLISSALITLNFLAPQKILGMDIPDPVDHHIVKQLVTEHLKANPVLLDSSKNKDIVVFLGNTGAGKSTLINYLSNKELEATRFNKIILKDPNDPSAMAIGTDHNSKTLLPKFIQAGDLLFYDFPGFKDTRGTATSLVSACFIKRIIENAKSAKLMFVVGMGQLNSDKAESFKVLLKQAEYLIPAQSIEKFSSLIITQSDQEKDILNEYIVETVDAQVPTLEFWLTNKKVAQMSKPKAQKIDQYEREHILHLIRVTDGNKIQSVNIGTMYNHRDQESIKKIYDLEMKNISDELIHKDFPDDDFSSLDIKTLEKKKKDLPNMLKIVSSSLEESSLIQLLRPIATNLYEVSMHNMERNLFPRLLIIGGKLDHAMREQEREEAEKRYKKAKEKIKNLRKNLVEAEEEIKNLRKNLVEAEEEIKNLRKNLVEAEEEIKNLRKKFVEAEQHVQDVESLYEKEKENHAQTKKDIEGLTDDIKFAKEQLEKNLTRLEVEEQRKKLEEVEKRRKEAEAAWQRQRAQQEAAEAALRYRVQQEAAELQRRQAQQTAATQPRKGPLNISYHPAYDYPGAAENVARNMSGATRKDPYSPF